jgi:hypothetical protein
MRTDNFGYISEKIINPKDYIFGGVSGIENQVLNPDADWFAWLPPLEVQNDDWGDTMSCVSFAMTNAVEVILKKKYGVDVNFSERALAKMSGTKRTGNTMSAVAETIRTQGLILEKHWPLDYANVNSWDEFYKEIPEDILIKGKRFLDEYDIKWEWVFNHEKIDEALQYAPLVTAVYAYPDIKDGVFQPSERWPNHNMLLYDVDNQNGVFRFYDNYKNSWKAYSKDYKLGAIIKFSINKKEEIMPKYTFNNNTLLQLVEGTGGFGLYLDGKIIIDDLDKILASWLVRNSGNISGMVRAVTSEIWTSFSHQNLKGELI